MLLGSLAEFSLHYRQWDWRIYSAGMACAALSVFIRRRCIRALGQFWSLHNEIRDSHKLVVVGPFRWVRHPTYLSMILELLAGALVLNAPRTLAFVAVLFLPTLWVRIKTEEAALVEKFGEEYRAYQRSTPALIPRTIPKQR